MNNVIIYDTNTGKIICVGQTKEWETPADNEVLYENPPPDIGSTHYVSNGLVLIRPVMPITVAGLVLSDVPANSTLYVEDDRYPCNGTVTLSFEFAGIYPLRIECFPYLDFNQEIVI
jgi:hypothetical protein